MPERFPLPFLLRCFGAVLISITAPMGFAQDDEDLPAPPPKKKDGVQITFLPPPMQGALSLGLYTPEGKLVRVLHKEATEKEFVVGLNGLITKWDGKDDKGEVLPAGKYAARGWMTGNLSVEGVAFHGNDWVKEDSPRYTEALYLKKNEDGGWQVVLRDAEAKEHTVSVAAETPASTEKLTVEASIADGTLTISQGDNRVKAPLEEGEKVVKASVGYGGNVWAIVETSDGREVRSYSPAGEFLRRLAYKKEDPAPFDLAASTSAERVLLLERNKREQRFRILAQPESTQEGSTWKTIDQKRIITGARFEDVANELGRDEVPKAEPFVKITSKLNPLFQNARADVQIQAVPGPEGAVLMTSDGLPLIQVTDSKGLKWCALVRDEKTLTLFQSDGSLIEEFKIGKPENLMAFDAGEYTFKR